MKKLFLGINVLVFAGLLTQSYQCIAGAERCFADPKSAKNYLLSQPNTAYQSKESTELNQQIDRQPKSTLTKEKSETARSSSVTHAPQYATNYVFDQNNQLVKTEIKALGASGKPLRQTTSANTLSTPVNINTADALTLDQTLNGIGAKKAEAIVAYRQTHGAFQTIDALSEVKGIGVATIEKNRHLIKLTD